MLYTREFKVKVSDYVFTKTNTWDVLREVKNRLKETYNEHLKAVDIDYNPKNNKIILILVFNLNSEFDLAFTERVIRDEFVGVKRIVEDVCGLFEYGNRLRQIKGVAYEG